MPAGDLAIELHLPVSLVAEQVRHLVETGLLGLMANPEGISLTKPPELISNQRGPGCHPPRTCRRCDGLAGYRGHCP